MALLDLSSRSPLQQKRMEELVDMVDGDGGPEAWSLLNFFFGLK